MPDQLQISDLHVSIDDEAILHGVDLSLQPGELHAIMGPNGSGKSTLAHTLAGHPDYTVTAGSVELGGEQLLELAPDERAQLGLFLAFQYPVEIPGVKVQNFLKHAYDARFGLLDEEPAQPEKAFDTVLAFRKHVQALAEKLEVDPKLLVRGLNEGFSGGEKKRLEILQMATLEPRYAVLDETDSGLDIDAIKAVAAGVRTIRDEYDTGMLVITHYQRILDYLEPDFVHVMKAGKIVESGGPEVAERLEAEGYDAVRGAK